MIGSESGTVLDFRMVLGSYGEKHQVRVYIDLLGVGCWSKPMEVE